MSWIGWRYTGYNVLTNPSVSLFFLSWLLLCSTAQQIFLKLHWYLKRSCHCEDMHIIHRKFGFINISGSSAHFELGIRVKWICVTLQWSKLRVCHLSVCVTLSLSPSQVKCVYFFLSLSKMSLYHLSVCVRLSFQVKWVCFSFIGVKWVCIILSLGKMSLCHHSIELNEFVSLFYGVKWVCTTLPQSKMSLYHPSTE